MAKRPIDKLADGIQTGMNLTYAILLLLFASFLFGCVGSCMVGMIAPGTPTGVSFFACAILTAIIFGIMLYSTATRRD